MTIPRIVPILTKIVGILAAAVAVAAAAVVALLPVVVVAVGQSIFPKSLCKAVSL